MREHCKNCGKLIGCFGGVCMDCIQAIKQTIQKIQKEAKYEIWDDWMKFEGEK